MTNGVTLPGFPDVELIQEQFQNWDRAITVPNVWTCIPKTADDVVKVCNWAAGAGFQVRASGIRHSWSPVTLLDGQSSAKVLLVDTTKHLNQVQSLTSGQVTVQTGMTMLDFMTYLEKPPAPATGSYSFAHIPAPGDITVGGALAINAHGTAVPTPPNEDLPISYGSLSNQILAFTAVVTDPASGSNTYALKTFKREDTDAVAFLTHIGRAFLVDVTLKIVDNYNLRCQSYMHIPNTTLFAQQTGTTPPPQSAGDFLAQSGRIEIIWFPSFPLFGFPVPSYPWLKVWTMAPEQPAGSTAVTGPYNYTFSDHLPPFLSEMLKKIVTDAPEVTPLFTATSASFTQSALYGGWGFADASDLWGPSKNTLIYVRDTTLLVTANGYAVQMKRGQVQQAIADFTAQFSKMLADFQKRSLYPINSPLEIRVTALDEYPKGQTTFSPVISGLSYDEVAQKNGWDVAAWFDVLTVQPAGDPQHANEFYAQLETWFNTHFGNDCRVMPEWSKGWAYTPTSGPWTSAPFIQGVRDNFTNGRTPGNNWAYEVATLAKYDKANLFTNPFLTTLFTT